MKVLIVEPGKHPYEAEIDSRLESLQKTVAISKPFIPSRIWWL